MLKKVLQDQEVGATRSVSGSSVGEFEEISFELTEVESKKNPKELEKIRKELKGTKR